jgi:hypothetical protein
MVFVIDNICIKNVAAKIKKLDFEQGFLLLKKTLK